MELLFIVLAALSLFAIGKVTIPSDPEAFLQRLIELRAKDELTDEESEELTALEERLQKTVSEDDDSRSGLTDEDLDNMMDRFIQRTKSNDDDDGSGKDDPDNRDINPNSDDADIEVVGERAAPWERRTVRYFNGLATMKEDQVEGQQIIRGVMSDIKDMNKRQIVDERKEAITLVKESGLTRAQKSRVLFGLDLETRLHTTSTTDTPKAGYLLPKPFLAEVFVIIEQYGLARQLLRGVPMSSKDLDLKNVSTKVVASWISEGARITADDLVFAEGQLSVGKLAGLTSWTTELSEDQAIAMLPIVSELFGESISEEEDKAAFLGDGTSTYGSMTGISQLSGVQTHTMGTGDTAADDLDESDLRSAKNLLSEARQQGAVWIMHRTIKDLIEQFENTAGNRIFQESLAGNGPDTLLGLPIFTSEVMPSATGVGADEAFIILGNPTRSLMGMRRGLTADVSREAVIADGAGAVTFNAFQQDGALLRLTERVGFKTPSANEDAFAVIATASS